MCMSTQIDIASYDIFQILCWYSFKMFINKTFAFRMLLWLKVRGWRSAEQIITCLTAWVNSVSFELLPHVVTMAHKAWLRIGLLHANTMQLILKIVTSSAVLKLVCLAAHVRGACLQCRGIITPPHSHLCSEQAVTGICTGTISKREAPFLTKPAAHYK